MTKAQIIGCVAIFIGVMAFSITNFLAAKNGAGEGEGLVPPMCAVVVVPIGIALYVVVSGRKE